jgi:hypothetical protein
VRLSKSCLYATYQVTQPVRTLGFPARLRFSFVGGPSDSYGGVIGGTTPEGIGEDFGGAMIDTLARNTRYGAGQI